MVEFDRFRQSFATLLLGFADRRRHGLANGHPTAKDLKVAVLFESLAADVENLDLQVYLICQLMFTHKHLARRFAQRRDDLLAQVGVSCHPASATHLVRWMTQRIVCDDQPLGLNVRPAGPDAI